jgi:Ser/Thr protein kinase RdoA (MazF antagonist)
VSVYTQITRPQLDQFFCNYALGEVISFEGIQDGINNTNYFVETTQGSFVLTLFETLTADELPHFMRLLSHLFKHNIPCPGPKPDRLANVLCEFNNKPAAVFKRIPGIATTLPSIEQCQEIGVHLANVHRCTQNYVFPIKNNNDLDWCRENGNINPDKMTALLSAYERLRPLEQLEKQHWQTMLRAASLRFWLSRLEHQLYPRPGDIIQQKDPLIFRQLLKQHRQ